MSRPKSSVHREFEDFSDDIETRTQFSDVLALLSHWRQLAKQGCTPALSSLEERFAGRAGANLMVLRGVAGDILYERVGMSVPALFGHDPSGRLLGEMPFRGAKVHRQRYLGCIECRSPLFSIQHKVDHGIPGAIERLILPVRLDDGATGLLVYVRTRADNYDLVRAIFNASQHGVVAVSAVRDDNGEPIDLKILAANLAAASLMGRTPDELIGRRILPLLKDDARAQLLSELRESLETGETRVFELNDANEYMPGIYRVSSASLGDGLAITISDLTQLRRALQTLETQHAALAKVNAELRSEVVRRRRLEAELKQLAATDPLTGIANRRGFTDAMTERFEIAVAEAGNPALIIFDVDDFKAINDRHGHPVGDLVLRKIAEVVSGRLSEAALLGRLGGEEFAVFLPNVDRASACRLAEELRKTVAQLVCVAEGVSVRVTASFGVAWTEDAGETIEKLIAAADDALYAAKRAGRNRVECPGGDIWGRNSETA